MTIRCLCVDDEPLARQGVALALAAHEGLELVAEAGSAEEALAGDLGQIDVLFLDIEMPRQSGFDLISQWPGPLPLTVFITAYNQYAVEAFEAEALDYLLKPIDDERFAKVIDRIRARLDAARQQRDADALLQTIGTLKRKLARREAAISVKTDEGYFRLELQDLVYVEAAGDHAFLYLKDRHLITRRPLKQFVADLADHDFFQVSKSLLLNKQHFVSAKRLAFGDYELTLSSGKSVRMTRRFKAALKRLVPDL